MDNKITQEISNRLSTDGFAICKAVLSPEEVTHYRSEAMHLYNKDRSDVEQGLRDKDADHKFYSKYGDHIFNLARKTREFDALYEHPLIISVISSALKNDKFILTQTEMRRPKQNVLAGSANVFHRDARFTADNDFWITAFWVLEDVTETNGPTCVLPGSHRRSDVNMESENNKAIKLLAKAGDVIFMNANLVHKATDSQDSSSRWLLIITYNQWYLKPTVNHTKYFSKEEAEHMSPLLRQLFGYTSLPPYDERKRMLTCSKWEDVVDEIDFRV